MHNGLEAMGCGENLRYLIIRDWSEESHVHCFKVVFHLPCKPYLIELLKSYLQKLYKIIVLPHYLPGDEFQESPLILTSDSALSYPWIQH